MEDYSSKLFENYRETHGDNSINLQVAFKHFGLYYDCYYKKHIEKYDKEARILEIGCNAGYMLEVMESRGYSNIVGIDLSPEDVEFAKQRLRANCEVICIDAFEYLSQNINKFDIIYTRAVMEHIAKEKIFDFLKLVNNALTQDGVALIEVPNMDWIWASHERYMDFTHEIGFTKQSLRQVMRNFFDNVSVEYTDNSKRFHGIKTFMARIIVGPLLYEPEPYVPKEAFFSKYILVIVKKHV